MECDKQCRLLYHEYQYSWIFSTETNCKKDKDKGGNHTKVWTAFFMHKIKKRSIFLIGIFGCFIFLLCMSNYIWSIEITGNNTITYEEMMDFLATENIEYGSLKRKIDPENLKKKIRISFENVIWDSVKIDGTKLSIEIKEGIGLQKETNILKSPTDIIANREGKIVKMITRKGIPNCKTGDTVSMNQIIVSGMIPITGEDGTVEKYQYCNADADIYLETKYKYEDQIPIEYSTKRFQQKVETIGMIEIMGREIMLPHKKNENKTYDSFTEMKQIKILDNFYLPIYFGKKTIREYQNVTLKYSDEEMEKLANKHLKEFIASLEEKGVQIIRKDVKIENKTKNKKEKQVIHGEITVVEKFGKHVPSKNKWNNQKISLSAWRIKE